MTQGIVVREKNNCNEEWNWMVGAAFKNENYASRLVMSLNLVDSRSNNSSKIFEKKSFESNKKDKRKLTYSYCMSKYFLYP